MEMFSSGRPIEAEEALRVGLLNHLVAPENLETFTYGLARQIRGNAPLSIQAAKVQLRLIARQMLTAAAPALGHARLAALGSGDYREGVAAFIERRVPHFVGR